MEEEIRLAATPTSNVPNTELSPPSKALAEQVVRWYRVYCGVLLFLWLIFTPAVIFIAAGLEGGSMSDLPPSSHRGEVSDSLRRQQQEQMLAAFLPMALVILPLSAAVVVALALKPSPNTWVYHIIIIALGLSGCTIFACVPLLIYWVKPEVQAYFGRNRAT